VFTFVQGSKNNRGKSIYLLLNTFLDILLELLTLVYALREGNISNSQGTLTLTMLEISLRGRALVEIVTSLVATW